MTLELPTPATAGVREIEWEHTSDTAVAAELNEDAYGLPRGEFAAAMTALSSGPATIYLAALDGRPAATLATLEEGGDCGVYLVATAPRARRRGLASALLSAALEEARAHGCVTSSLQATRAGFPVYERLGYRDRGALEMWERRFA
jgi:GNAT superfamily N-acetyltransferase